MDVPAKIKELGIEKIVFGPAALKVGGETVDIKLSYGVLQERTGYVLNAIAVHDDLLEALVELVKAHDLKMGKSAVTLRIERARDAIARSKG